MNNYYMPSNYQPRNETSNQDYSQNSSPSKKKKIYKIFTILGLTHTLFAITLAIVLALITYFVDGGDYFFYSESLFIYVMSYFVLIPGLFGLICLIISFFIRKLVLQTILVIICLLGCSYLLITTTSYRGVSSSDYSDY